MFFSSKPKKIFILLGHPDVDSLNGTLALEYEKGALSAGHEVRRQNIGEMQFDPILHHGYKVIQPYEPDLVAFQENVNWADHFVVIYPTWWSTMPALLKGLFDRVWMPRFAFHFKNDFMWDKLLKGKSASIIVTSDTMPFLLWVMFGDTVRTLKKGILWFAGFGPIRVHRFGYLKHTGMNRRLRLQNKVFNYGRNAK